MSWPDVAIMGGSLGGALQQLDAPDSASGAAADELERMREALTTPLIIDGRNLYDPASVARHGFEYVSIGRRFAQPAGAD